MSRILLKDLSDTRRLGLCLSKVIRPGDVLLLSGDLGAGKTTLTRFFAQGLGIDERQVTSPTFGIIHEYSGGRVPLVHVDLYRLGEGAEIMDTGIDEYLAGEVVLVVEWADFLSEPLADESLVIHLVLDGNARVATLSARGRGWEERISLIGKCLDKGDSI